MPFEVGEHRPPLVRLRRGDLGLLVLEGLVLRRLEVMGRQGVELLGDGDVLRPWDGIEESLSLPSSASVKVCRPASVAVLDRDFHRTVVEDPEITAELLERMAARSTSTTYSLALAQQASLLGRLLCLLWHLSDRWGRVDRRGRVLDLPLQHQTLAEMVAARRPSVTSSLRRLAERELVLPLGRSRGFRLLGAPPVEPDRDSAELLAERPLIGGGGYSPTRMESSRNNWGRSRKEVGDVMHALKRDLPGGGGKTPNPDLHIDETTGEAYPIGPGGKLGDSIGNIHDFLR